MNNKQENKQTAIEKVDELIEETGKPLLRTKTIFPFKIFPTKIEIDKKMVNLIFYIFFFSKDTYPILIKDIKSVQVATNFLFGSLRIEVEGYEKNPAKINFLPKRQAEKVEYLVMGLKLLYNEKIDVSSIDKDLLVKKAIKLGKAHSLTKK